MKRLRWEYLVVSHEGEGRGSQMGRLNELGAQGWELVAFEGNYSYLKRLKSSEPVTDDRRSLETMIMDRQPE